jgi:hypothetical protein
MRSKKSLLLARQMERCCELRQKLADEFATAARLYAEAVVALTRFPTTPQAKYDRFREKAEQAQVRVEQASTAFEEHVDLHRCTDAIGTDQSTGENAKASVVGHS